MSPLCSKNAFLIVPQVLTKEKIFLYLKFSLNSLKNKLYLVVSKMVIGFTFWFTVKNAFSKIIIRA